MKSKRFGALAVALISLLALILGLRLAVGSQADASAKGGLLLLEPLDVAAVTPNSAPNDLDTPIVISGTGFTAVLSGAQVITPPSVFLGNVPLPEVTWVSSTQLLSVVPWGMDPASYPLTVANPDGMTDSLSGAFTVTQGIGVWTTDGPYGGSVRDLAVRQTDPSTVFAVVSMAGLYQSRDGGGHWERTGLGPGIGFEQIAYGLASPNTLCACGVAGLWQSPDHGQTWSAIVEGTSLMAFAQHPTDSSILYVSRWDTGIFRSGDGGQTWESRSQGIDLLRVRRIVIDPEAPATLYAATDEYGVYKSTDEGLTWAVADFGLADDPDDNAYRLAINPFSTDNLWAAGVYGGHLFRSDDGAESWVTVPITYPVQRALTFSPVVSGTLYVGAGHDLLVSSDGGSHWDRLSQTFIPGMIEHIRVDPDAGTPLYLGTNGGGFYRSSDGGRQWEQAVQGMAGIEPRAVVPAPDDPERVYFTAVDGAFHSNSGGLTWAKGKDGEMWVAAVDQRTAWWPMAAHGDRAPSARPPTGG